MPEIEAEIEAINVNGVTVNVKELPKLAKNLLEKGGSIFDILKSLNYQSPFSPKFVLKIVRTDGIQETQDDVDKITEILDALKKRIELLEKSVGELSKK